MSNVKLLCSIHSLTGSGGTALGCIERVSMLIHPNAGYFSAKCHLQVTSLDSNRVTIKIVKADQKNSSLESRLICAQFV